MPPQKITFGEMRPGGGPTGILIYCADYRCSHSIEMSTSSPGSSARHAASAVPMCGRISSLR